MGGVWEGCGGGQVSPRWVIYVWGRRAQRKGDGLGSLRGEKGGTPGEERGARHGADSSVPSESLGPRGDWSCSRWWGLLVQGSCLHCGIGGTWRGDVVGREEQRGIWVNSCEGHVPGAPGESHRDPQCAPKA